nr:UvrD-helicase domain-containing protein [Brevibacterium daeguense]
MKDIVSTIQAAQYQVIAHEPKSLLVIQGGPGTGKSVVALHRVSWLLFNQKGLKSEDVLVVGPNTTFTKYIQDVLPALGDHDIRHLALDQLVRDFGVRGGHDRPAIARIKGDRRMHDVLAEGLRQRVRSVSTGLAVRRASSNLTVDIPAAVVQGLVKPLSYLPYSEGRARFVEALRGELQRALGSRSSATFDRTFDAVSFNQQVDRVWPTLSPQQFLRELLGSTRRLKDAGEQELSPDELKLLYRPAARYIGDEPWTVEDAFLLHEVRALIGADYQRRYAHIVVDEAQDLSAMQLMALERLSENGAMTLVGDIAQSTGPFARDSWDPIMTALHRDGMPASRQTLKHVYRVPSEIFDVANALQDEVAPHLDPPQSVRSTGVPPTVVNADAEVVAQGVANRARTHAGSGLMVGVVAAAPLLAQISAVLDAEGVRHSLPENGSLGTNINLLAPDQVKGLEFDAVVIADPDGIYRTDDGARLLYIALTRATARLDLVLAESRVPAPLSEVLAGFEWTELRAPEPQPELESGAVAGPGPEVLNEKLPPDRTAAEADHPVVESTAAADAHGAPLAMTASSAVPASERREEAGPGALLQEQEPGRRAVQHEPGLNTGGGQPVPAAPYLAGSLTDSMADAAAALLIQQVQSMVAPGLVLPVVERMLVKLREEQVDR